MWWVSIRLDFPNAVGPSGADVNQDVQDLIIAHGVAEAGHAALEPVDPLGLRQGLAAEFRVVEQKPVVVMPGMPGRVMRWRGQYPVTSGLPPVRLAFELRAVTEGTVLPVQGQAIPDIPAVEFVAGERHCGPQQGENRQGTLRATSTQVFMPEGVAVQEPSAGLSNTQSMSRPCRGSIRVVSR